MSRTISPEEFSSIRSTASKVLDIRRQEDYDASDEIISGAEWLDPTKIDDWVDSVPRDGQVVIYCVRGGGVSNSVVDRLQSEGVDASYIEGGIVALAGSAHLSTK